MQLYKSEKGDLYGFPFPLYWSSSIFLLRHTGKRMTNQAPESEAISEPPPETMLLVERSARAVARGGLEVEKTLLSYAFAFALYYPSPSPYSFLKSSDPYHAFYLKKRDEYIAELRDEPLRIKVGVKRPPPPPKCRVDEFEPPPERDQPKRYGQPKRDPPPLKELSIPAEITLMELGVIKLTALFVARYGITFWKNLVKDVCLKPLFTFMKRDDSKFSFYNGLVLAYQRVLRPRSGHFLLDGFSHCLEQLDENVIYLHAFVAGLDCFNDHSGLLSATMPLPPPQPQPQPQPQPLSMHLDMPPSNTNTQNQQRTPPEHFIVARIPLKQLGIMKLTALFVARYGKNFRRELMMRVVKLPHFEFMFFRFDEPFPGTRPAEIYFLVFSILESAYSSVLKPCKRSRKKLDESVLESFFHRLQIEKLVEEEASDETATAAAVMDLHAFVAAVDYVAHRDYSVYSYHLPPPERLTVMMSPPTRTHPGVLVQLSRGLIRTTAYSRIPFGRLPFDRPRSLQTIPPKEDLPIIKLTAQFLVRFGQSFEDALMKMRRSTVPENFEVIDRWRDVIYIFYDVYYRVLKLVEVKKFDDSIAVAYEVFLNCLENRGRETSVVSFINGVDYFASVDDDDAYSTVLPSSECHLSRQHFSSLRYSTSWPFHSSHIKRVTFYEGAPVSFGELAVMKVTAVFVARYGVRICRDLMEVAGMNYDLMFMEPANCRFGLYKAAVDAYSKVLSSWDYADTKTVLERYASLLRKRVSVLDLYGFVEGVDCFALMEDAHYSGLMGNPLTEIPGMYCCPQLTTPEAKRQKLDEQFLDSSKIIRVRTPVLNGSKVIAISGNLLSETVASLKEKIAEVIHMPVNKLKLSGKSGFLKDDDKSLAHNDVGPGDILTLSWFISRWSS